MKTNKPHWVLDIEIYQEWGEDFLAQAKYLVHGYDDVMWTNDLDEAILFLKESTMSIEKHNKL